MAIEQVRAIRNAEYYLQETSLTPSVWKGNAAKLIGIHGQPVDRDTFLNLFAGYTTDEDGFRDKKLPKYMHPDRRGAFDLTANNPKSVSIMSEVGQDSRIDSVIQKAREAVEKEVEMQARVRVTRKADIEASKAKMPKGWRRPERRPQNLAMFWADHPASRLNDPARHGHLVIMNLSYDKQEKTWKALELGHLDQQKIADIYRDTMRKGLNELGYKTKAVGKEYEIVGVPAEIKGMFSRRHTAIKELEVDYEGRTGKPMGSKAKGKLSVYRRPEKPKDIPLPSRRAGWLSRMTEAQRKVVAGVVNRAKAAVKNRSFSHWQQGIARHAEKLRQNAITQEPIERSRDHGRDR